MRQKNISKLVHISPSKNNIAKGYQISLTIQTLIGKHSTCNASEHILEIRFDIYLREFHGALMSSFFFCFF